MRLIPVTITVDHSARALAVYIRPALKLIAKRPHDARFMCPDGGRIFSIHCGKASAGLVSLS